MVFELIKIRKENFEIITGNDGLDILNNVIQDQSKGNLIKCIITVQNMEFVNGSEAINFLYQLKKGNMINGIDIIFLYNDEEERNNFNHLNNNIEYDFISKLISFEGFHRILIKKKIFC